MVYNGIEGDRGSPKEALVLRKPGNYVYITDATDLASFLEPDVLLPASVIRFTEYLGSIIAGASLSPSPEWQTLKRKCRRRPGRKPCPGSIRVRIGEETPPEIDWDCPRCGESGIIRNWRGSEWDNSDDRWNLFEAERSYAESLFQDLAGDSEGSLRALERALSFQPDYPPAIFSMGSFEYLRGKEEEGKRLLLSMVKFPDDAPDLEEIIDEAGTFLIDHREHEDGLALYRVAAERFPETAMFHAGRGCCAGHLERHEESLDALRRAVELDPDNQAYVNDLGWSQVLAGRLDEAVGTLERAASMDPSDELARENLARCNAKILEREKER
jgi:Flp pilus assembly protein TadD